MQYLTTSPYECEKLAEAKKTWNAELFTAVWILTKLANIFTQFMMSENIFSFDNENYPSNI
jgi:hypothetical protein